MMGRPAVLIVDDDRVLLRALDRALRRRADEWDVTLVEGGASAERALCAQPFDVVVTDLRMMEPGTRVLACARRTAPNAVRVVMTSDPVGTELFDAHVVLEKPMSLECFEDMLVAAVVVARLIASMNPEI
jgi:DNA-binding NtrC family response regulator